MKVVIRHISCYLPARTVTNKELVSGSATWTAQKIEEKTGILTRHAVEPHMCSSDMVYLAAEKLFTESGINKGEIDFILLCTQTPDYLLPTSACILQHRLGLATNCGALDFNLGCSGYVYGLGLAKGLIENDQAKNVLLLTADTYTRLLKLNDISTRSIFGDAGTATLIGKEGDSNASFDFCIGKPIYGTDGSGANNLIVKAGGMRMPYESTCHTEDKFLFMNGPEIFNFTLKIVPSIVMQLATSTKIDIEDFDMFVFHQANLFILEHLRRKMKISKNKFYINLKQVGNTVSSSIPLALRAAYDEKQIKANNKIMLVGFGVGYSWAGVVLG